ncbi:hypothetical protein OKW21_006123 [Catalinimonas alkaloidigena]|uniref:hypothetical protein n=1 Tax=Catalinimonas alkaloidigena TaxID=1075417 RepID=UPI0024051B95|nr:hypothetical protein [Catalinimonas alkaloidigena]MDF9800860.1 hypothetical protein [Catalinimonas alkaloidigena]
MKKNNPKDIGPIFEESFSLITSTATLLVIGFSEYFLLNAMHIHAVISLILSFITVYIIAGYFIYRVKLYSDKLIYLYPIRLIRRRKVYYPIIINSVAYNQGGARDSPSLVVTFKFKGDDFNKSIILSGFNTKDKKLKYFQLLEEHGIKTVDN